MYLRDVRDHDHPRTAHQPDRRAAIRQSAITQDEPVLGLVQFSALCRPRRYADLGKGIAAWTSKGGAEIGIITVYRGGQLHQRGASDRSQKL